MTDDSPEQRVEELEEEVDELRETVQKMMPSRRDVLKMSGAAAAGAAGVYGATGSASAGTDQVGTIGTASSPVDVKIEDLYDDSDNIVASAPGDGSVNIPSATGTDLQYESVDTGEVLNDNYVEPQVTASASSSYTADLTTGNYHKVTLNGDVSFDVSNADASETNSLMLHLVQDSTGGRTPSFTPTVVWDSGSAPSWSTAANAEDVITLVHDQDASQWLGFVGGLGMA